MRLQYSQWAPALEVLGFAVRYGEDLFANMGLLMSYWYFRFALQSFTIPLCHELFITIVVIRSSRYLWISRVFDWHFPTIYALQPCGGTLNSPSELVGTETLIGIFLCRCLLSCIFPQTRNKVQAALGNLFTYLSMISSSSKNPYFLIACSLANLLFRMIAGVDCGFWLEEFVVFEIVFFSYYKSIFLIYL